MLIAYFGPETMLPLTSILAAAGGFFLMFGRQAMRILRGVFGRKPTKTGTTAIPREGLRTDSPAREKYRPTLVDTPAPATSIDQEVRS